MPSNIAHYLSSNSRLPTDVDFEVYSATSSPTPVHVGAHKCFLADASTVFDEMFFKNTKPEEDTGKVTVRIDNVNESVFRMFLKHFYGEKIEVGRLDIVSVLEILELVQKYGIEDLKEEIVERIKREQVKEENILDIVGHLKKPTNLSNCVVKYVVEKMVSNFLQVKYGRSVSGLANLLYEKSVDGETICYMMKIIAKAGVVDNQEQSKNDISASEDKREMLRRFLVYASFPEDHVDNLVDKFIVEDAVE